MGLISSCRGRKETVYGWKNKEESRTLTLLPDGIFVLNINAGYYNRIDTGTYLMHGDTLILNPDKQANASDSVVVMDSLFMGNRYVEVYEEEVTVDNNEVAESFYRPTIFPAVKINGSVPLSLIPEDPGYHKLLIPDSIAVSSVVITRREANTCRPFYDVQVNIPEGRNDQGKSYRIYLPSKQRTENYLGGFKWLVKGKTIESFFKEDTCDPIGITLKRK